MATLESWLVDALVARTRHWPIAPALLAAGDARTPLRVVARVGNEHEHLVERAVDLDRVLQERRRHGASEHGRPGSRERDPPSIRPWIFGKERPLGSGVPSIIGEQSG